ncbi:hypothetical protein DPMN_175072 [Dreissena polymorpha]|uniref:Uncharacterized protein n=1 Tax=Dreissena polymorpha TaxID=45954 RepID=A0A9D4IHR4_DREPO|nr:hypothetical protein DPMN_175072 [Dreissena polymorpha]
MAANRLQDKQQSKWVEDITDMMAEGPRVILRLPKIRQAVIESPESMLWFSKVKTELEMLWLEMGKILNCEDDNGVVDESDAILQEIFRV